MIIHSDLAKILISVIATVFILMSAAVVLQPLAWAFFLALIFHMPLTALEKRGFPRGVTTLLFLSLTFFLIALVASAVVEPARQISESLPKAAENLEKRIDQIRRSLLLTQAKGGPVGDVAAEVVDAIDSKASEGLIGQLTTLLQGTALSFASFLSNTIIVFTVAGFLLSIRSPFLTLATLSAGSFANKRRAARLWQRMERSLSQYLAVTSIINLGLGACVGITFALLGMPSPIFWGVLAGLLNYVLFVGPTVGIALSFAISLITFDTVQSALIPPLAYFAINMLEANFVTPTFVGKRMNIPPLAIIIALIFGSWLWGVTGLILAVPFLVLLRTTTENKRSPSLAYRLLVDRQ